MEMEGLTDGVVDSVNNATDFVETTSNKYPVLLFTDIHTRTTHPSLGLYSWAISISSKTPHVQNKSSDAWRW